MIYVAFYRGKPDKDEGLVYYYRSIIGDTLTRMFTKGPYSHCELVYPLNDELGQHRCYTASIRDKGVRVKDMVLNQDKWDLIPLDQFFDYDENKHNALTLEVFFQQLIGAPYDFLGAIGVVFGSHDESDKWFCSEIAAAYLGLPETWRYHPNNLHALLQYKRT